MQVRNSSTGNESSLVSEGNLDKEEAGRTLTVELGIGRPGLHLHPAAPRPWGTRQASFLSGLCLLIYKAHVSYGLSVV